MAYYFSSHQLFLPMRQKAFLSSFEHSPLPSLPRKLTFQVLEILFIGMFKRYNFKNSKGSENGKDMNGYQ